MYLSLPQPDVLCVKCGPSAALQMWQNFLRLLESFSLSLEKSESFDLFLLLEVFLSFLRLRKTCHNLLPLTFLLLLPSYLLFSLRRHFLPYLHLLQDIICFLIVCKPPSYYSQWHIKVLCYLYRITIGNLFSVCIVGKSGVKPQISGIWQLDRNKYAESITVLRSPKKIPFNICYYAMSIVKMLVTTLICQSKHCKWKLQFHLFWLFLNILINFW